MDGPGPDDEELRRIIRAGVQIEQFDARLVGG